MERTLSMKAASEKYDKAFERDILPSEPGSSVAVRDKNNAVRISRLNLPDDQKSR
jgi:hypothetical protein